MEILHGAFHRIKCHQWSPPITCNNLNPKTINHLLNLIFNIHQWEYLFQKTTMPTINKIIILTINPTIHIINNHNSNTNHLNNTNHHNNNTNHHLNNISHLHNNFSHLHNNINHLHNNINHLHNNIRLLHNSLLHNNNTNHLHKNFNHLLKLLNNLLSNKMIKSETNQQWLITMDFGDHNYSPLRMQFYEIINKYMKSQLRLICFFNNTILVKN